MPTPDGTGVAIHPSVIDFGAVGWNGYRYWMAFTPYASADSSKENPCIVASQDGTTWVVPAGGTNPIEPWGGITGQYNSDTHLYFEGGTLYCVFRAVEGSNMERTYYKTSTDGITWSAKVKMWEALNTASRPLAPSVFRDPDSGTYIAYVVDIVPSTRLVRRTAPALTGPWTSTDCVITGASALPWHADVHLVEGEYEALIQIGDDKGGDLVAAVSTDGINFTAGGALLDRNVGGWDSTYYRSAFLPVRQGGIFGWDAWISSGHFTASGNTMGRTFITFTTEAKQAAAVAADAKANARVNDMLAARVPLSPWIAGDSFARADAASLGTADSGHAWTAGAGAFAIVSRAAQPPTSANHVSTINTGVTDHWATVRLDSAAGFTAQQYVLGRYADGSNYYRLGFATAGGILSLQKIIATDPFVVGIGSWSITAAEKQPGMVIGLRCVGTTLRVYVNDVEVGSVTDSTHTTSTRAGIQANGPAATFRNFRVRAA